MSNSPEEAPAVTRDAMSRGYLKPSSVSDTSEYRALEATSANSDMVSIGLFFPILLARNPPKGANMMDPIGFTATKTLYFGIRSSSFASGKS